MNGKDYYFKLVANDPYVFYFIITPKAHWDQYKCWSRESTDEDAFFRLGFERMEESIYEFNGEIGVGRQKLLSSGFIENNNL